MLAGQHEVEHVAEDAAYVVGGAALGADAWHQQGPLMSRSSSVSRDGRADDGAEGPHRSGVRVERPQVVEHGPGDASGPPRCGRAGTAAPSGLEVSASTKTPVPCARAVVEHRLEAAEAEVRARR